MKCTVVFQAIAKIIGGASGALQIGKCHFQLTEELKWVGQVFLLKLAAGTVVPFLLSLPDSRNNFNAEVKRRSQIL